MTDKIILTDCDGVLLDWEAGFRPWVTRQGYYYQRNAEVNWDVSKKLGITNKEAISLIERFNSSSDFERLPSMRDSVHVVKRMHSQGWRFIVITSIGLHPWSKGLRKNNLDLVFGPDIFDKIYTLPVNGDKSIFLRDYQDSDLLWIEDNPLNAELGYKHGLRPLLINHTSNSQYMGDVPRVSSWADIESIATSYKWPARVAQG